MLHYLRAEVQITSRDYVHDGSFFFTENHTEKGPLLTNRDVSIDVYYQFEKAGLADKLNCDSADLLRLAKPIVWHPSWLQDLDEAFDEVADEAAEEVHEDAAESEAGASTEQTGDMLQLLDNKAPASSGSQQPETPKKAAVESLAGEQPSMPEVSPEKQVQEKIKGATPKAAAKGLLTAGARPVPPPTKRRRAAAY